MISVPSTKPLTIVVAINPSASFGRTKDVGPAVVSTLRALGHTVVSLTEPSFEELRESGRIAVKAKPDALVVVGGDGMVNDELFSGLDASAVENMIAIRPGSPTSAGNGR